MVWSEPALAVGIALLVAIVLAQLLPLPLVTYSTTWSKLRECMKGSDRLPAGASAPLTRSRRRP